MKKYPCSAYNKVGGIVYFARMIDKIRLKASEELPLEYHKNLGVGLFDRHCCLFLAVPYQTIVDRVLQDHSDSDEKILAWCFDTGHKPDDEHCLIWNAFMTKKGFRDDYTELLNRFKEEGGLSHRNEIQTLFDYYEFDEGRAS